MLLGLSLSLCALFTLSFFALPKLPNPALQSVARSSLALITLALGALFIYGTLPPVSLWAITLIAASGPVAAITTHGLPTRLQRKGTLLACVIALSTLLLPAHPITDLAPQPNTLVLALVAFATASLALGFFLRAALLTEFTLSHKLPAWPSPLHLLSALCAFLALRQLSLLGASLSTPHLPLLDSKLQPAYWVLDLDVGLPIATPIPALGGLLLAAVALPLITSFIPKSPASAFASVLSCAILIAPIVWIFSLQGETVELVPDTATELLTRLNANPSLLKSPLYLGSAPFTIATRGIEGALVLLGFASGLSLVGAFDFIGSSNTHSTETVDVPHYTLQSRNSLQIATTFLIVALSIVLFLSFLLLGVWGPQSTREHSLTAVTLISGASLFVLHALPADTFNARNAIARALCIVLPIAALLGLFAGGLFSSLSWFSMS